MIKQKIVVNVRMRCQKCRSQALTVAASSDGVSFVGLEGEAKDNVVVIGEGVDAVKLTSKLRKKVGHSDLITVEALKTS